MAVCSECGCTKLFERVEIMSENKEIVRSQSSVKIARNAKGEASYEIKAYADTIDEAIALAVEADQRVASELAKEGK